MLVSFVLSDLIGQSFVFQHGDKAGEPGINLKARLLKIHWAKVDGESVVSRQAASRSHMAWLKERAGDERINSSSIRSVKGLLAALLRVASSHVLVLHTEGSVFTVRTEGPTILIRLYPEFRRVIVNLHALVLENKLKHITYDLKDLEHAWIVPNPTLVMYIFPHLAGTQRTPVPGWLRHDLHAL